MIGITCFSKLRKPSLASTAPASTLNSNKHNEQFKEQKKVITDYLSAAKWEDRLAFVRSPDLIKSWMAEYYRDTKFNGPISYSNIEERTDISLPEGFSAFNVKFTDNELRTFYLEKTSQGYKIDWEMFVYNRRSIITFKVDMPLAPETFRVHAKLSDYYNYKYRDAKQSHYSLDLSFPISQTKNDRETIYGFVERDSADGKALYDILKDGEYHKVMLMLRYPPGSEKSQCAEIFRFIQSGWLLKDQKQAIRETHIVNSPNSETDIMTDAEIHDEV